MKIIKTATVYKATLPSTQALEKHLAEIPFAPISEVMVSQAGFVNNETTGELVTPIPGGYSFTMRYDEKILPAKAVKRAIKEKLAKAAEEADAPLTEEEEAKLTDSVRAELIANALVKTTIVTAFYCVADEMLIVHTSSKRHADRLVNLLIQAAGSVTTTTIHVSDVKGGLTTRLKNHLAGAERAFDGFNLGDSCVLKGDAGKATFDLENLDTARQGLSEALEAKMIVERLELEHGTMSFKLTSDFSIRGIVFFGELTEDEQQEREDFDTAQLWRTEASIQMLQLVAAIKALCDLLGYQEDRDAPKEAGEDQQEEGHADQE